MAHITWKQAGKIKLPRELDRRVKLTDAQRAAIKIEYAAGGTSYNKLAQKYGVSKRLVIFIVNPECLKAARERFKERRMDGRYYPSKEKWAATMREHRRYKYDVLNHFAHPSKMVMPNNRNEKILKQR